MNLRTSPYIANLSLDQNGWVDCFQCFDRCFCLTDVFFKRQRGEVEDDSVEACLSRFDRAGKGVCMIRIQKDWEIKFGAQALHEGPDPGDLQVFRNSIAPCVSGCKVTRYASGA